MTKIASERRRAPRNDDPQLRGRRSEPRAYVVLPASTEALSGYRQVRLLDVSQSGARLEGADLPCTGKDMLIRCGGIETFGTVAWSAGERCGVHFDEPLRPRDLVSLRALAAQTENCPMTPEEREAAADWLNGLAR